MITADKHFPTAADLCTRAAQHIARGEHTQALQIFQEVTKKLPKHIDAYIGIATLMELHGKVNHALQTLSYALRIEPENSHLLRQITPLLADLAPTRFNLELEQDLLLCLNSNLLDHQQLANTIASLICAKYQTLAVNQELLLQLNSDTLLLQYLSRCINTHAHCEAWLSKIRQLLLANVIATERATHFEELICAIALTCFANEYVFCVSDEEIQQLEQLDQDYQSKAATPKQKARLLATKGMYVPLINCITVEQLQHVDSLDTALWQNLIEKSLLDLQEERLLRSSIARLNENANQSNSDISAQVKAQYEENPYPRWQIPPAPKPTKIVNFLQQLPAIDKSKFTQQNLQVLIAGCGTGYEPIDLARTDNSLNITALDLSSSSLAYAKRMAAKLDLHHLQFVQGNILDAAQLNKDFDLINSTGVLHHMENPLAGWNVLCSILKPGGVMRISLYSELARRRIVLAHQRIKELGLQNSSEDIKKFRRDIFQQPSNSALGELAQSDDFYSLSGCRDLLFHVQEHRFTLPQLKSAIEHLPLKLIGFDAPLWALKKFQQRHSNKIDLVNLDKWHEFEVAFPDTFVGMYQLWLQKQ